MKGLRFLAPVAMLAILIWVGIGCSNPDNVNYPEVPNINDDNPGDVLDPGIPPSFVVPEDEGDGLGFIADMAFEKDGDIVFSNGAGLLLFDPFAQFKRNIGGGYWDALVDTGPGVNDSGRSIIASGPDADPGQCTWVAFYDDEFVTGGSPMAGSDTAWWGGEAHPPDGCGGTTASGAFGCPDQGPPRGIDLHPIYGWLFLKIANPKIAPDGDCDLEPIPTDWDLGDGIMAVHPMAPQNGFDPYFYEGTADFIVYHNKGDVDGINAYGFPMCDAAVQIFCWDETMG